MRKLEERQETDRKKDPLLNCELSVDEWSLQRVEVDVF